MKMTTKTRGGVSGVAQVSVSELYVQQLLQKQRDRIFTKFQLKTSERRLSELLC